MKASRLSVALAAAVIAGLAGFATSDAGLIAKGVSGKTIQLAGWNYQQKQKGQNGGGGGGGGGGGSGGGGNSTTPDESTTG